MDELSINPETLISLVEERNILWDKTSESYKDKRQTLKAWHDICTIIKEDFNDLPNAEKNTYGKKVIQKWKNMRDGWMKCEKKLRENKSGSATKNVHKYPYYDNMLFLNKIYNPRETNSNLHKNSEPAKSKPNSRNKELSDADARFIKFMDSVEKEDESRMMSFFKGILPTVERFNDEDTVEFQYQVMSIVRNIKAKNQQLQSAGSKRPYFTPPPETVYRREGENLSYESTYQYGYSTAAGSGRPATQQSSYSEGSESYVGGEPNNSSQYNFASPSNSSIDELDFTNL